MKTLRMPIYLFSLITLATLAGCGGGGSGGDGGAGSISGRVSDLIALPVAGRADADSARITVEGTDLSATVNPDGTFTINGVPAGLRTVIARTPTHAAAISARVSPGKETNIGEIALREAGQISGLVSSAQNNTPIPNARVVVTELIYENTADVAPHPVRSTRTGATGSYTVDGLPTGEYLVTVDKEGFESESLVAYVMPFSTTPGDIRLQTADPAAKGVMTGTAYLISDDGSKAPVAGVLVRLIPGGSTTPPMPPDRPLPETAIGAGGNSMDLYPGRGASIRARDRYTHTDENGVYTLDGIPAGDYIAAAVRPGLVPEQKQVTVTGSATLTVDFQLQLHRPRIGAIEGTVVNAANGEPVANAHVSLIAGPMPMPIAFPDSATSGSGYVGPGAVGGGANGSPGHGGGSGGIYIVPDEYDFYVTTDSQGRFRMRAPAGEVMLDVWAEGFLPGQQTVQVPLNGVATVAFRLTKHVRREVTLSGRVIMGDSSTSARPVAGATVYASPISDNYHIMGGGGAESGVTTGGSRMHPYIVYQAETDSAGQYTLKLQSGSYYLYATKDNLYSEPNRMDILADTTLEFVVKEYDVTYPPGSGGRRR